MYLIKTKGVTLIYFVQNYFECVHRKHEAVFIAIGLSFVNADIFSRWAFCIFMFFLVSFMCCCCNFDPKYSDYEVFSSYNLKYNSD